MIKGLRLKSLREDNDLYQSDVANHLKIPRSTYADYERQKNSIPIEVLYKIAVFYKVSVQYICGLTDVKEPYGEFKNFNRQNFIKNIRNLRKSHNIEIDDLASSLYCDKVTIIRYESNKRKISLETLIILSEIYNLEIDYILDIVQNT